MNFKTQKQKKILFTGGGSAGHVTPNIPLIRYFQSQGWDVCYIGSQTGIEHQIISELKVSYEAIATGKWRRYFSWQNFIDPFRIIWGAFQALGHLLKQRPDVVFSKGGFVAFPVVFAAWVLRIPVVAHESDLTPGLANRMSFPMVKTICVTFEAGKRYFKESPKVQVTGTPLRDELFQGSVESGRKIAGLSGEKPCLLFIGGGSGSGIINKVLRSALPQLLPRFEIIHICGPGKSDPQIQEPGYFQIEYASDELPHFYACADCVISRSGANSVYEILALKKPHIFIPLSAKASRGDQIHNAQYFEQQGLSRVIAEENLSPERLIEEIQSCFHDFNQITQRLRDCVIESGTLPIAKILMASTQSH